MKSLRLVLSCLILSGIIIFSTPVVNAAEVLTLKNVTQRDVYDYILAENLKKGYVIKSISEYNLLLEDMKKKDIQFALNWGLDAKRLHTFNVAQTGENVIVSYEIQIISNPGGLDETVNVASKENINNSSFPCSEDLIAGYKATKNTLRSLKAAFNGIYMYGFSYELKYKQILITKVWPDLPASKSGMLAGDKIIRINDIDLTTMEDEAIHELLMNGKTDSTIRLIISRDDQEVPLSVTKQFVPPSFKKQ